MKPETSLPEARRQILVRVSEEDDSRRRLHLIELEDANNNDNSINEKIVALTHPDDLEDGLFNNSHRIFSDGACAIRHYLVPFYVNNGRECPRALLRYFDVQSVVGERTHVNDVARVIQSLDEDVVAKLEKTVSLEYKPAAIDVAASSRDEQLVCRVRGLPWEASDQHVAQFFAGLEIVPGGIALCLSSEGRRNGEALIHFADQESRDLALRRHKNFLLSRYIEVYKSTLDKFLHVASGSSAEAMEFLSANGVIIRMRGLPYDCTDVQIKAFFEPLKLVDNILFITRPDGRPTGDAFVQFENDNDAGEALQRHRKTIGQRYIELFKSTVAEVQQVVKRCAQNPASPPEAEEKRRDCVRLRGLPYEAQVQNIITFLGEYAAMVKFQGVHMIFNNQGHPSGEAFIQMISEQAAYATANAVHNKFMVIGKKQRYIEVFQCSPEDLNLQHLVKPYQPQPQQQQFWTSYPSPPISPILPGQLTQIVVYGLAMNMGYQELINHFTTPEVSVENIVFTRFPTPICAGEAVVTLRSRQTPMPTPTPIHPQFIAAPFIQPPIIME